MYICLSMSAPSCSMLLTHWLVEMSHSCYLEPFLLHLYYSICPRIFLGTCYTFAIYAQIFLLFIGWDHPSQLNILPYDIMIFGLKGICFSQVGWGFCCMFAFFTWIGDVVPWWNSTLQASLVMTHMSCSWNASLFCYIYIYIYILYIFFKHV